MKRAQPNFKYNSALRSVVIGFYVIALAGISLAALASLARAQNAAPSSTPTNSRAQIIELRIGDEIEPVMAEYVDSGLAEAAQRHAALVLITMDAPGGLSTSMEDIVQHILDSPVPVAVYISPAG